MKLKLIIALVQDEHTEDVLEAAREAGATGSTVIGRVHGEGIAPERSFLGLEVQSVGNALLFVVAEGSAAGILERIAEAGQFGAQTGSGIAFQVAVEDAVGLDTQLGALAQVEEERL